MKLGMKTFILAGLMVGAYGSVWAQSDDENSGQDQGSVAENGDAAGGVAVADMDELSQTVASVNGEPITLGEVLIMKSEMPAEYLAGDDAANLAVLVDQIAAQQILAEQVVDTPLLDIQVMHGQRTLKANATLRAYIAENLDDAYLQATYDEVIGNQPDEPEWNASHILLTSEEDAQAVKARVEGGEDFAEVAKTESTGPSAPNGGALDWFGPGQMVPEFENAVKDLEPGQMSDPVQTQFGWHIVMLNDKRTREKPDFEQVRPQITDYASSKLIDEYITSLEGKTEIKIEDGVDPSFINKALPE